MLNTLGGFQFGFLLSLLQSNKPLDLSEGKQLFKASGLRASVLEGERRNGAAALGQVLLPPASLLEPLGTGVEPSWPLTSMLDMDAGPGVDLGRTGGSGLDDKDASG
jgi:hypothetical protein